MNDATRDPIGADARPATFDAWANEYCYGLFNDGDDGARVALLAARDAWDAAIACATRLVDSQIHPDLNDKLDSLKPLNTLTETAPARIWLQVDPQGSPVDCAERFPDDTSGVTWCSEDVGGVQVEYVRADLAKGRRDEPNHRHQRAG